MRTDRRRALALVVLTLAGVLAGVCPAGPAFGEARSSGAAVVAPSNILTVDVPATVSAGTPIPVTVNGVSDGTEVTLAAIGSAGTMASTAAARAGRADFTLDADFTRASGDVKVIATAAGGAATAAVLIEPGPAVDPITPVVGARSIVADGLDRSMVVSMPQDDLGNVIAEGSALEVARQHPDGTVDAQPVVVSHLLTWALLPAGTTAGTNQIWLRATGVTGPTRSLDEVAAPPAPFTLEPVDAQLAATVRADGQTLVPIRTSLLADGFGNVEPDGTAVTFDWLGPDGPSRTQAVTIGGVASASIPAPALPADLPVTASCRGSTSSQALLLTFPSAVPNVPLTVHDAAGGQTGKILVSVGPVLEPGGAYLPDGTVVAVVVTPQQGGVVTAAGQLVDGKAELVVPVGGARSGATVQATVLGTVGTATLP